MAASSAAVMGSEVGVVEGVVVVVAGETAVLVVVLAEVAEDEAWALGSPGSEQAARKRSAARRAIDAGRTLLPLTETVTTSHCQSSRELTTRATNPRMGPSR